MDGIDNRPATVRFRAARLCEDAVFHCCASRVRFGCSSAVVKSDVDWRHFGTGQRS